MALRDGRRDRGARMTRFDAMRGVCLKKPHGTRQRYVGGCKCMPCRAANSRYETERALARKNGDWNGVVDASPARSHLRSLSKAGVGRDSIAAACDVPASTIDKIRKGEKPRIRNRTLSRILAVDERARAAHSTVPIGPTLRLIDELVSDGYTRAQIAVWMGYETPALQFRSQLITVQRAVDFERLYKRIRAGLVAR